MRLTGLVQPYMTRGSKRAAEAQHEDNDCWSRDCRLIGGMGAPAHRIIRRAYEPSSGYGRMVEAAFDAWNILWDDLGQRHMVESGVLCVSQEYGDEAEQFRASLDAIGGAYEVTAANEVRQRYPFLDPERLKYIFRASDGGELLCGDIATHLLRWIKAKGSEVLCGSRVTHLDPGVGNVQLETGDILTADLRVITVGTWTLELVPELADQLSPGRTFVVYVEPPSDLVSAWVSSPAILSVGGNTEGYILPPVLGTGLKFGASFTSEMNVDSSQEWSSNPVGLEKLRDAFSPPIARIGEYRITSSRTCAFMQTRDSRFFSTAIGKILVVSACSGHGYKFGPAVGLKIAAAISEGRPDDLSLWLRGECG